MTSHRILELDGLRACAVLAVISFHYCGAQGWGWMGVDLFFVLSGFLITSILLAARQRPRYFRDFYARRTLRIFPVYYLLLGLYVLAAWGWGGAQPWRYWGMHAGFLSATIEVFRSWNFLAPAWVYAGVTVLWSLSIEEQFYLLWAPLVRWLRPSGLWAVLIAAIVGAPLVRWWMHTRYFPEYRFLPARFDSLAWGAVLALVWQACRSSQRDRLIRGLARTGAAAGLALALLLAATGGRRESLAFAIFGYSVLAVFFAAVVGWTVASANSRQPLCRCLRWRPLRYLGTISYTTYLIHYPILLATGTFLARWPGLGWLHVILALVLVLLVASASWRWLEAPLLRRKSRVTEPNPAPLRTIVVA